MQTDEHAARRWKIRTCDSGPYALPGLPRASSLLQFGPLQSQYNMNVGHLPDNTPIKSLADSIICTECGHVGADMTSQTGGPHYGILNAEFQKWALQSGLWLRRS
jgi:hypothetical protein